MSCLSEKLVKAIRKAAECCGCGVVIEAGSPAVRWTGFNPDRDFTSVVYHPECRGAEAALNYEQGTYDEEWQNLREAMDNEPDNRLWLIEEHPDAAAHFAWSKAP